MKCEIIRDLLPSYLDGLTSEESNREIEVHLKECGECREIAEALREETEPNTDAAEQKKISPFRKVNRKLKLSIAAAVIVCVALGGAFWEAFVKGWGVDPAEVNLITTVSENGLEIAVELEEGKVLSANAFADNTEIWIGLRQVLQMPGDDRGKYPGNFSFGLDSSFLESAWEGDIAAYPVVIDYGKEEIRYTVGELLEMGK